MKIIPIKTRIVRLPKDNIFDLFAPDKLKLRDGDILLVTSKIVSIHQGRCIPMSSVKNKDDLIKKEADFFIPREEVPGKATVLTIKNSTLIASAGVDENKSAGFYILWPEKPEREAEKICQYIKEKFSINRLAVIITDSHTTPLRPGVIGTSIGFFGLEPYRKYHNESGVEIIASRVNIVDSLAAAAVICMGEYDELTPLAIIRETDIVDFTNQETYQKTFMPQEKDIYYPLLKNFRSK